MKNRIDFELIEKLLRDKNKKMSDLYKFVGYSRQSSMNYKSQGYIPIKHAMKISQFLSVPMDSLFEMDLSDTDLFTKIAYDAKERENVLKDQYEDVQMDDTYIELPTIHAGAGAIGYAVDVPEHRSYPKELIPANVALDDNVLVIIVAGNSMEPLYYENDIVFIDIVNGREFTQIQCRSRT